MYSLVKVPSQPLEVVNLTPLVPGSQKFYHKTPCELAATGQQYKYANQPHQAILSPQILNYLVQEVIIRKHSLKHGINFFY